MFGDLNQSEKMSGWLKILFMSVLFSFSNCMLSQENIKFSREPEVYLTQVEEILHNSPNISVRKNSVTVMPQFVEAWNSGLFAGNEIDAIIEISQIMADKRFDKDAIFFLFIKDINHIAHSDIGHESIYNYLIYTKKVLSLKDKNAVKGCFSYADDFFEKHILNTMGGIKWYLFDAKISFPRSDEFVVSVEEGTLVCASEKDSLAIRKTNGVFSKDDKSWVGKGGSTSWESLNISGKKPYAELSDYSINMATNGYVADSVMFYNLLSSDTAVLGQLQDKAFAVKQDKKSKYPVFRSYKKDVFADVFNNISLTGCAGVQNHQFYMFPDSSNQTMMTVSRGDTILAKFIAETFEIGNDKLKADDVSVTVYLDGDSIVHNRQSLMYDNAAREIILYNPNKSMGNGPYSDTYHKVFIFCDAMLWKIDESEIRSHKLVAQYQDSRAYFKSMNFYDEMDWDRLQGMDVRNPLALVNDYLNGYDTDVVDVQLFAMFLKRNVEQVVSIVMHLAEQGYLIYDAQNKVAYPTRTFYRVIGARNGDSDYDVIKIDSHTTGGMPNMVLDLLNKGLTINGIRNVVISNAKNVAIVPYDNTIVVKKNLDFEFSGKMMAGLFEFHTHSSHFNYSDFVIELPTVDSLVFFVRNRDNALDNRRIKNVLTNVSGKVYIDESTNRSGVVDNSDYPIFDCDKDSQVDFEQVSFILPPFTFDSLFTFSASDFSLKGTVRTGIFKDFEDELIIKDDYTLGFSHNTEKNGMEIVGSEAKFNNEVKLSNEKLYGVGTLNFMTASAESDHVTFDDTMAYMHGKFEMLAVDDLISIPHAAADSVEIKMHTKDNTMVVYTLTDAIELSNGCTFRGEMCLKQNGLYGKGLLNMNGATVESNSFVFKNNFFTAESANMVIVDDSGSDNLIVSNYSLSIDFDDTIVSFKNVGNNGNIIFAKNNVMFGADSAEWRFDDGTASLSSEYAKPIVPADSDAVIPAIEVRKMDYNFADNTILVHDVDSLPIADVVVLPSDGDLQIKENAVIQAAGTATIHSPSITIHDALIDSIGKNHYFAKGYMDYVDPDDHVTPLYFNEIYPDQNGMTVGFGKIEETDNFLINSDCLFKGDISFKSGTEPINFDGCFKMIHPCLADYKWFKATNINGSKDISLLLDNDTLPSKCGLYFDDDNKEFFVEFFTENLIYKPDKTVLSFNDELYFDSEYQRLISSGVILQKDSCFVLGKGEMNLGINTKHMNFLTDGMFAYDIQNDEISLSVQAMLDFTFDDKLVDYLAFMLFGSEEKDFPGIRSRNEMIVMMNDLRMKWVSSLHCFVSEPEIHINNFNSHAAKGYYDAVVLIDYQDIPTLMFHLKNEDGQWMFLKYCGGKMEVLTSDADFNDRLEKMDEKKRSFVEKDTQETYEYGVGRNADVDNLLLRLQYLQGK